MMKESSSIGQNVKSKSWKFESVSNRVNKYSCHLPVVSTGAPAVRAVYFAQRDTTSLVYCLARRDMSLTNCGQISIHHSER
jgi:hypothetical protein